MLCHATLIMHVLCYVFEGDFLLLLLLLYAQEKKITLTIKSRKECLQKKKNQSVQMAQAMCRPQPS